MRTLVITNRYPPHHAGGYEIACHAVTERLHKQSHDVKVLTSNYGLNGTTNVEGNVHRLLHRPQDSPKLQELARWELADNGTLRQLVNKWQPDVIYAWCMLQLFPSLYLTLHELSVPLVFNIQDLWLPTHLDEGDRQRKAWLKSGSNPAKALAKTAIRSAYKRRDATWLRPVTIANLDLSHVIFCSSFRQKQHVASGLPLGDSRVIYNGIDLSEFKGTPSSNGNVHLRMLFVGRLVQEKGAHTVIEAVAKLIQSGFRNFTLSIAGVPAYPLEYSESLRQIVEQNVLHQHVRFLGQVPNHDLPDVYRQHDVLVFPSICDEGLPVTLLEAMACGITVIGTTTGGSIEILSDGANSLTFPPGDAEALRDQIARLSKDAGLRRSLASAGQALVHERFNIEKVTHQTVEYLQIVANN